MKNLIVCVFGFVLPALLHAAPCSGIDRELAENRKSQLEAVVKRQLNLNFSEILESYRYKNWSIVLVETHVSDEPYLFFHGNPLMSRYVTLWAGAARRTETKKMKEWAIRNAPGIPAKLASCFAWHVTQDR